MAKRIRRTPLELKAFNTVVAYYMADGYPRWYAEEIAWDLFHTERQLKRGTFRSKVEA